MSEKQQILLKKITPRLNFLSEWPEKQARRGHAPDVVVCEGGIKDLEVRVVNVLEHQTGRLALRVSHDVQQLDDVCASAQVLQDLDFPAYFFFGGGWFKHEGKFSQHCVRFVTIGLRHVVICGGFSLYKIAAFFDRTARRSRLHQTITQVEHFF